jgi:protein involved in polysaccharide export with SLBB domain
MKKFDGIIRTGSRWWVTLFCLGVCLAAAGSWGQVQIPHRQEKKPALDESLLPEEEQPAGISLEELLEGKTTINLQALEGPIDPATYKLGPGDLIGVTVMGQVDKEISARVTADGALRLPTIGLFNVGNRIFAEVKEEILAQARSRYRTPQMAVYLLELRSFKASVGGRVRQPGTYAMTPIDRVASLVSRAGGFYNPAAPKKVPAQPTAVTEERDGQTHQSDLLPPVPAYSSRRVELIHRDGTKQNVDLLMFLRAGRAEGNPYLQDGDFLLVPPLNPQTGLLGVFGAVNNQGIIEFLPGDDLGRALLLAGELTLEARRDSVEITRFAEDHTGYSTFYVSLDDSGALATVLCADDRIFVRPSNLYHPRFQVELLGEVMKPGFYPVSAEGTRLADILRLAGGCTPRAGLREATLTRRFGQELVDPEYERLRLMTAAEMTPLEYQYYKAKSQESKGRVVLDLYRLYVKGDSTQNILLRDQDVLEVPVISRTVKISGQVTQPGIVDYSPGKDYTWYVQKSGGFSWHANRGKARIIKAISGKWVKPGKTDIEEGDTIFIPEKIDVNYWQISKDIMMVLAQAATIYLVIQNAHK